MSPQQSPSTTASPPDTLADRLAYVEALVDMNALVLEAIWPSSKNTTNTTNNNANDLVPLRSFIHQVLKRSRTTYSTLQTAFFYLFRARPAILRQLALHNHPHLAYIQCGRRMFLASIMVASKFVQDKTYRNSAWATMAGLGVQEINLAERVFLELMGYRLYVAQATFDQWHALLHTHVQAKSNSLKSSPPSPQQQQHPLFAPPSHHPTPTTNKSTRLPSSSSLSPPLLATPALSPSSTASACSSPNVPSPNPHSTTNKKRALESPSSVVNKKQQLEPPSLTKHNKRSLAHLLNSPQDPISRKRPCLSTSSI